MTVFFIFARNTKWWGWPFSWLIKELDGTDFSHCEIGISIGADNKNVTLFGGEFPLSRKIGFTEWSEIYQVVHMYRIDVDDEAKSKEMLNWLYAKLNKPYNVFQLIMILIDKLSAGYLSRKVSKADRLYGYICSELVGEFMIKFFGVDFHKTEDLIDLQDVLDKAKEITGAS